jgi:hypothetical protein
MTDNIGRSPEAWRNYSTRVPIAAFRMKRGDLKRLYQISNDKQIQYRDRLLGNLSKVPPESDEEFEARKKKVQDAFVTSVSVTGINGESVHGNTEVFFDSPNIPEYIRSILISTKSVPQAVLNIPPLCSVVVFLDFSCPPIFNFGRLPTLPTPNGSNFEVAADNESWFTATNAKLTQFFSDRKTNTNWLHRAAVYDILLIFLGLPFAIWFAYRAGNAFEKAMLPLIVMSAVYVYTFLMALALFRVLLSYSRWVFPKVELDSELSSRFRHKGVLGTITLALVGTFLADSLRYLFS